MVVVEVDEDQHKGRACECEQTRMVNISQAMGAGQTVWIRYNPDSFKSPKSRLWSKNKRLDLLVRWMRHVLNPDVTLPFCVNVLHLFFDGFRESSVEWKELITM